MTVFLLLAVTFLALANGANDNFKGVATLWGAGLGSYRQSIAWATAFTFLGSITAIWFGSRLAAKFSGVQLVGSAALNNIPVSHGCNRRCGGPQSYWPQSLGFRSPPRTR